jgi:hypothetical protein
MKELTNKVNLDGPNVHMLAVKDDPKSLLELAQPQLERLRTPLLQPFKTRFSAPNKVALYLFRDGSWVVENFTDETVDVELNQQPMKLPARGWVQRWK